MYAEKDFARSRVSCWTNEAAKLHSSFSRVTKQSLPLALTSQPIHQETLRIWERSARDQSCICNQAAALSRCLTKVQDAMIRQLKVILTYKAKGKSASKTPEATDELDYLMTFNRTITQAMARTIPDLSEGVFFNMANLTVTSRDSYMDYLKVIVKQDTHRPHERISSHGFLFSDHLVAKAE